MIGRIKLHLGDITKLKVDAIVNAANNTLLGGGGVDGAIHRAAGSELLEACRKLLGCATGQTKITPGFNLPSKWVMHTVGPIWSGGSHDEAELLAQCYRNSLKIAAEKKMRGIAFPAISCGVYGYPHEEAVNIAIREVLDFIKDNPYPKEIIFVSFSESLFKIYEMVLKQHKF